MKSTITKNYDLLTADERLRLALHAMTTDDTAELTRLHVSCPRKQYEMWDADYVDAFIASQTIVLTFAVWWFWWQQRYYGAVIAFVGAHREGNQEEAVRMLVLQQTRAGQLMGVWAGFERFCTAARLDAYTLLAAWWPPILAEVEQTRPHLADQLPDAEQEAATYDILASWWTELRPTLKGTNAGRRE